MNTNTTLNSVQLNKLRAHSLNRTAPTSTEPSDPVDTFQKAEKPSLGDRILKLSQVMEYTSATTCLLGVFSAMPTIFPQVGYSSTVPLAMMTAGAIGLGMTLAVRELGNRLL